jgi:hypothetical protein
MSSKMHLNLNNNRKKTVAGKYLVTVLHSTVSSWLAALLTALSLSFFSVLHHGNKKYITKVLQARRFAISQQAVHRIATESSFRPLATHGNDACSHANSQSGSKKLLVSIFRVSRQCFGCWPNCWKQRFFRAARNVTNELFSRIYCRAS